MARTTRGGGRKTETGNKRASDRADRDREAASTATAPTAAAPTDAGRRDEDGAARAAEVQGEDAIGREPAPGLPPEAPRDPMEAEAIATQHAGGPVADPGAASDPPAEGAGPDAEETAARDARVGGAAAATGPAEDAGTPAPKPEMPAEDAPTEAGPGTAEAESLPEAAAAEENPERAGAPEGAGPQEPAATEEKPDSADTPGDSDRAPADAAGVATGSSLATLPPPPPRRGGFVAPLLGGVLAAAIGAAAVLYLYPDGWRTGDEGLETRLAALESRPAPPDAAAIDDRIAGAVADDLAPLNARLEALEAVEPPDVAALEERLAALAERLEAAEAVDIDAFERRLQSLATRIEAAEVDAPGPDLGPLERGIDTLNDRLAALEESREAAIAAAAGEAVRAALAEARAEQEARAQEIDAAAAELAGEQARLAARTALTELAVAAESGAPAPDALARVAALEAPPAPFEAFADGLPTLAGLQADFPAAARRALTAAPVAPDASLGDRVVGFLRNQAGARSLAPRAGNDPDAVLSRAEAAVREGRIADALDELDALPPDAAAELADWRARAERRTEALAALAEMQARLGSE